MNFHLPIVADHNELTAAFHQMKAASAHFGIKRFTPNFMFHIAHRTADNAATLCRLGAKDCVAP